MSIVMALLAMVSISAQPSCDDPDADIWVKDMHERVESFDLLARYATERFGPPQTCHGSVTSEFDGMKFGFLRLGYRGGATFEVETVPPEGSMVTLRAASGLGDIAFAREALEDYAFNIGLEVDWDTPSETMEGGERIQSFHDSDSGLNARASLIFREDLLVAVRLSMAL